MATEADNGKTITLHVGDTLIVRLANTYWTINDSSNPPVLRSSGSELYSPQPTGCVPGQGCGEVSRTFTAVSSGQADVTATRTSCGEAERCSPASQGSYLITVVVS